MENKIKAIDPKIIVNRDVNRPYYSIEYYDTSDNKWHIGYGSYDLENVVGWLDTEFEVVESDVEPVKHGHWMVTIGEISDGYHLKNMPAYRCSLCGRCEAIKYSYCHCGAKMDKEV